MQREIKYGLSRKYAKARHGKLKITTLNNSTVIVNNESELSTGQVNQRVGSGHDFQRDIGNYSIRKECWL